MVYVKQDFYGKVAYFTHRIFNASDRDLVVGERVVFSGFVFPSGKGDGHEALQGNKNGTESLVFNQSLERFEMSGHAEAFDWWFVIGVAQIKETVT